MNDPGGDSAPPKFLYTKRKRNRRPGERHAALNRIIVPPNKQTIMKKLFLIAVAALSMGLVSCGGGEGNASGEEQKAEAITDGNTFEGKNYTVTYPKDWKETMTMDDVLNAKSADDAISFSINFAEDGPTVDQLKTTGEGVKMMNKDDYKEIGDPKIEGNTMTVRRVSNEGEVETWFNVVFEGKKGVVGSIKAPADKEADAEKALKSILASLKAK